MLALYLVQRYVFETKGLSQVVLAADKVRLGWTDTWRHSFRVSGMAMDLLVRSSSDSGQSFSLTVTLGKVPRHSWRSIHDPTGLSFS